MALNTDNPRAWLKPRPPSRARPFWEVFDRMPDDNDLSVADGTRGVVVLANTSGAPYAVCLDCAELWPDEAARKRYPTRLAQSATEPDQTTDDGLASMVPDDGIDVAGLMGLWKKADRQTRDIARRLVATGLLNVVESPSSRGGAPKKTYVRAAR